MKNPDSTKNVSSRRFFIKSLAKSIAIGGGSLYLLGKMGNPITAHDLEVYSEPKKAKSPNDPIGYCQCGIGGNCSGSGGGGQCQCGIGGNCGGSGL